ncbi:MAG: methylated-DNA--[protein]-cysteine S-methyltransferase [Solirubrobacterales bacterium]
MSRITGRQIVDGLRGLREAAPASLTSRVLEATGMDGLDRYSEMQGPIWPLLVAWGPTGITAIERADDPGSFEDDYATRFGRRVRREAAVPAPLTKTVLRSIAGDRLPDLQVDLRGLPEFQRQVLAKTMEIPYGEVRPYAWVANEIGHPRAQRAVGTALARNPIPFVIPCHRVVRSDGHIGNYGAGGPSAKRAVLRSEGVDPDELERLANKGVRYLGSDTTNIFCFPTCRNARRIAPQHQVRFRTEDDAEALGFRACKVCRPTATVAVA